MGLLDGILFGGNDPSLEPGTAGGGGFMNPRVALAAGLLSGRGNLGANLAVGLSGANQAAQANRQFGLTQEATERANRANDLQQLSGLYQTVLFNDMAKAIQDRKMGIPHVPDPALGQLQAKMGQLAGLPPLSTGGGILGNLPQAGDLRGNPSATQGPTIGGSGASPSASPRQPGLLGAGQNFLGANPNYQPLPAPTNAQPNYQRLPTSQTSQPSGTNPFQDQRDEADMYALMAHKPELLAENRYKLSLPVLSRGVSFNPGTGLPIYGMVDNTPVRFDPSGNPSVVQSDIPNAIAQRAGMVAGAQAGAKAPYQTVNYTDASGASNPRFLPQVPGFPGAQPSPPIPGASSAIPAAVLAADRSGSPFVATQAPGGPVQFQTPPSNAAANDNASPGAWWPDMPKVQPMQMGAGGQSTYAKGIAERQAAAAEKLSEELGTAAANASNGIAVNNQALDAVNKADTGWMANHLADFRNVLATLAPTGSDLAKSAADQAATDQVLAKDLVGAALQRGKQLFGSRFTQSEVGIMLTRAAPSPEMAKAAIKFLLESDNAIKGYAVQQASDFGRYYQSGGDPLQFKGAYAKKFPVTDTLKQVHLDQTAAPVNLPANVVALPNGKLATFPSPEAAAQFRAHIGAQ